MPIGGLACGMRLAFLLGHRHPNRERNGGFVKHAQIAAFILIAAALSACGDASSFRSKAPKGAYTGIGASKDPLVADDGDPEFDCPEEDNVFPDYDRNMDGSGFYRVCTHSQAPARIKLHGKTHQSDTVCAIPAEYINQSTIYLKPEHLGGPLMVRCAEIKEGGMVFDFPPNTRFNSVFVVEGHQRDQMLACLPYGNYYLCPTYSFGKFR